MGPEHLEQSQRGPSPLKAPNQRLTNRKKTITMETIEEEYLVDETEPDEETLLEETWPITRESLVKEFEEYLLDIGVRI